MRLTSTRDPARDVATLAASAVNYRPGQTGGRRWHHDRVVQHLPAEPPGPPRTGGPWELACGIVRDYEFPSPRIIRGYWAEQPDTGPVGRDMLLEGRFLFLRFPMGVRVDAEIDETRPAPDGAPCRRWGWSYQTLDDHLERGRLTYEVVKNLANGEVDFVVTGVSRGARIDNAIVRAGFSVFGRPMQRLFYRGCGRRLRRLVEDALNGVVPPRPRRAPRDATGAILVAPGALPAVGRRFPAATRGHRQDRD